MFQETDIYSKMYKSWCAKAGFAQVDIFLLCDFNRFDVILAFNGMSVLALTFWFTKKLFFINTPLQLSPLYDLKAYVSQEILN